MNSTYDNSHAQATGLSADQGQKARLFVYENLRYVGESAFTKESILIGKSNDADLVLDHQSIADIHALIQIDRDQVLLINKNLNNGLRLNGLAVKESALHAEDVIQLGPFSIIFRPDRQPVAAAASVGRITERVTYFPKAAKEIPREPAVKETLLEPAVQPDTQSGTFAVILVDRYASTQARRDAVAQLAALFRAEEPAIEKLMSRPRPVLKRNLDRLSAFRLQDTLHDVGILSMVRSQDPAEVQSAVSKTMGSQVRALAATTGIQIQKTQPPPAERFQAPPPTAQIMVPDEDEEDEEIWEAPFILKERLLGAGAHARGAQRGSSQVQVIKTLDDAIVDVAFVNKGQKYYLHRPQGRLCLVENRADEQAYLFIDPHLSGHAMADGQARSDLDHYRTDAYLHRRRKELYRLPFAGRESAMVSDGRSQYHLSLVEERVSPGVKTAVQAKPVTWRHWASSFGTHLLVALCLSGYLYFQSAAPQKQMPHFVKVDMEALRALEPKAEIRPEPKKEPPPPTPTPEPQRVVETVKPTEKKVAAKVAPRNAPKTAAPKTAPQEEAAQAQAQPPSRDPNAGGGFGEGNIANRNVNQTGILSILSKNVVPGPSTAMASVTNLDAVQVPGATEKNFTVGGIKGSLGSGKISMGGSGAVDPSSIVQTKGSQQVLRSAGASGPGEVAALERGTTGQKQVKAMVTARMTQTVKIEGGMSREMVKQVIDQHLGEITFCYESALSSNPNISGRVIFEWKILLSGRVGEVRIMASNINSNEIHDCIKSAIKSWQFPNPVGAEVIVSYPFVFDLVAF
ncbi:MAG: AgmX/PglI C-terminal domain-containing protein [Desulfatitalea sp.]